VGTRLSLLTCKLLLIGSWGAGLLNESFSITLTMRIRMAICRFKWSRS